MRPLPGQVVVVEDRGAPGAHLGGDHGRGRVEGERADVLHDDEVGRCQCVAQLARGRRLGSVHRETRQHHIDEAGTSDRGDPPTQSAERIGPLGSLHGDPVPPAEAERNEARRGHDGTVGRTVGSAVGRTVGWAVGRTLGRTVGGASWAPAWHEEEPALG